jgi:hypothetical protein
MEKRHISPAFLRRKIIEFGLKSYLQVLFVIGASLSKPTWVDKHVKSCYNKLDEINSKYDKTNRHL